jgi:hypothetical protein
MKMLKMNPREDRFVVEMTKGEIDYIEHNFHLNGAGDLLDRQCNPDSPEFKENCADDGEYEELREVYKELYPVYRKANSELRNFLWIMMLLINGKDSIQQIVDEEGEERAAAVATKASIQWLDEMRIDSFIAEWEKGTLRPQTDEERN